MELDDAVRTARFNPPCKRSLREKQRYGNKEVKTTGTRLTSCELTTTKLWSPPPKTERKKKGSGSVLAAPGFGGSVPSAVDALDDGGALAGGAHGPLTTTGTSEFLSVFVPS